MVISLFKGNRSLLICLILLILSVSAGSVEADAQRIYKPHSVLSAGSWVKIAVTDPGVYKIDIPFLNKAGFSGSIPSASIRLFGNTGAMLEESCSSKPVDDLEENAVYIQDGGDNLLNGNDYILFYAPGPDKWIKDSVNKRFSHQKNIYSDTSYYFLSAGGSGKRIVSQPPPGPPVAEVSTFDERYFHELDTVNFLFSGKEWYGEEFSDAPGKTLTRTFLIPGTVPVNATVTLVTSCAARSINSPGKFDIAANSQPVLHMDIPFTGAGAYDAFAKELKQSATFSSSLANLSLSFVYTPGSFNSQAWLNWFEVHYRKPLSMGGSGQLSFRDWNSTGNPVAEFVLSGAGSNTLVWDITDPMNPVSEQGTVSGNELRFRAPANTLHEYIAFNSYLTPDLVGKVANQDLHDITPTDLIVVTGNQLITEAERLAAYHLQKENLKSRVVTTEEIYNEFSSGSQDPAAIRDFVKMYYDKAIAGNSKRPGYLLLFGDASFDFKNRTGTGAAIVPGYQSNASLDPLSTYTSDDFYGFLDDNEDINSQLVSNQLDIGIGRVPASTPAQAKNYVDKVIAYHTSGSFGPWRNNLTFIADDEDQNLHLDDAELITGTVGSTNPLFDIQKIYLDAYHQQSFSGGQRYPEVNDLIRNKVLNGTLIWNYNGHGSSRRLAEEVILDQSIADSWNNVNRLPLFITATCDFAAYDNPFDFSLGEGLLLRPSTGAIALMTTTRLVFAFSNRVMNNNYLRIALTPLPDGTYESLGKAVMDAKNYTYQTSSDIINNRKFTLLGDPALTLGFPELTVKAIRINGIDTTQADTLSATEKVIIDGVITDKNGTIVNGFNGKAYVTVFDKPQTVKTLGNDPTSIITDFTVQNSIIYKGKSTVTNGHFQTEFIVPKDLNYQFGNGKMSFYAEDGQREAAGYFDHFISGGNAGNPVTDNTGPVIKAWLNDDKFVDGSIANARPVLILQLSDSSGINTIGTGIGHDITVTIDSDNNNFYKLNDFFEADADNYRQGRVRFQLPDFEPGMHYLTIKAWDVMNNSSDKLLEFSVVDDGELQIRHVLNYPNPFTTRTQFWFEHNKPGQELKVDIQVFTMAGKIIKHISETINTTGNRSCDVEWDGRDDFGAKIGRGVYIYKLRVTAPGLKPKVVFERLVIL